MRSTRAKPVLFLRELFLLVVIAASCTVAGASEINGVWIYATPTSGTSATTFQVHAEAMDAKHEVHFSGIGGEDVWYYASDDGWWEYSIDGIAKGSTWSSGVTFSWYYWCNGQQAGNLSCQDSWPFADQPVTNLFIGEHTIHFVFHDTDNGNTYYGDVTVTVSSNGPLAVSTTSLPDGLKNASYSAALSASGGTPPYNWSIASGTLPSGLSLLSSSGTIVGTPTSVGTSSFTVQVTDSNSNSATKPLSITVSNDIQSPLEVSTTALPDATLQVSYSATLAAVGGTAPYTWSITAGVLPPGLSLNSNTGVVSGAPSGTGNYSFTVQVQDSVSATASKNLAINVGGVSTECSVGSGPNPLVLMSIDYYYLTLDGLEYVGTSTWPGFVTVVSTYPSCIQTGYAWASVAPLIMTGYTAPVPHGEYWASFFYWQDSGGPPVFYYPYVVTGEQVVFGVNVTNGAVFQTSDNVTLIIYQEIL